MIDPRTLLGRKLKDDEILEFIGNHDLKVWYDIDTDHENIPDAYWIQDYTHGLEIKCDENQIVSCCFLFLRPTDEYSAFAWSLPDLAICDGRIPTLGEPTKSGAYEGVTWVRYDGAELSIHVSSDEHGPKKLTFMLRSQAP